MGFAKFANVKLGCAENAKIASKNKEKFAGRVKLSFPHRAHN